MLFNSYIFVLFFLPVTVFVYHSINKYGFFKLSQLFLIGMSLWFYGYLVPSYLILISASTVFNYGLYKLFRKNFTASLRKGLLYLGVSVNIAALAYFKYYNFFINNLNAAFNTDFPLKHILLPLGISFFTFRQLGFIIDAYKDDSFDYDFLSYALFVTFFPQLVSGPIVTHDEFIPQLLSQSRHKADWERISEGIYLFALGLAKKVILADSLGKSVDWGYNNIGALDSVNTLILCVAYSMQLYFDFSGYSDMAVGIGEMFNINLPQNFNSPYKACDMEEFWERWHMTLTRFFTKYVYIPLGGNRKGSVRTYINIIIVFLLSGLWHGADWSFVLWGLLNGLFVVFCKLLKDRIKSVPKAIGIAATFATWSLLGILFRADGIGQALSFLAGFRRISFGGINPNILKVFVPGISTLFYGDGLSVFYISAFFLVCFAILFFARNTAELIEDFRPEFKKVAYCVLLYAYCIMSFSQVSSFLYFSF